MIDAEITYSDSSERVHHLKIMIKIEPGDEQRNVWTIRNRILDMRRVEKTRWPDKLKVQVEVNLWKKPFVTEM